MELLLPVALALFPNMLPSTFTDSFKEVSSTRGRAQRGGADAEPSRRRMRRSASFSKSASRWLNSCKRRSARVASRAPTRSRNPRRSRSSSARWRRPALQRFDVATRADFASCLCSRFDLLAKLPLRMKLFRSPGFLRMTSRSTTCPDLNSSPCAGSFQVIKLKSSAPQLKPTLQLHEHQRLWYRQLSPLHDPLPYEEDPRGRQGLSLHPLYRFISN